MLGLGLSIILDMLFIVKHTQQKATFDMLNCILCPADAGIDDDTRAVIDKFYNDIVHALLAAASSTVSRKQVNFAKFW